MYGHIKLTITTGVFITLSNKVYLKMYEQVTHRKTNDLFFTQNHIILKLSINILDGSQRLNKSLALVIVLRENASCL